VTIKRDAHDPSLAIILKAKPVGKFRAQSHRAIMVTRVAIYNCNLPEHDHESSMGGFEEQDRSSYFECFEHFVAAFLLA
jgi:hypothetical protein